MEENIIRPSIVVLLLTVQTCVEATSYYKPNLEKTHKIQSYDGYKTTNDEHLTNASKYALNTQTPYDHAKQQRKQTTTWPKDHHARKVKSAEFIDQSEDKRLVIEYIPFVKPISNLIKHLDYKFQKKIQSLWKDDKRSNHIKPIKIKKQRPKDSDVRKNLQINITQLPYQRKPRSTVVLKKRKNNTTISLAVLSTSETPFHNILTPEHTTTSPNSMINSKTLLKEIVTKSAPNMNKNMNTYTRLIRTPETRTQTNIEVTTNVMNIFSPIPSEELVKRVSILQQMFADALDKFERKYYTATFDKLSSISTADRRENGISFVQSGLFLYLILTALSLEVHPDTRAEIDSCLDFEGSDTDKLEMIQRVLNQLPSSSDDLKLRWSTRLVVNSSWESTSKAAGALRLRLEKLVGNETPDQLVKMLNLMVEKDSGGAMHYTFEEDELSDGVSAVLINTLYVRARWRAAPTLLNGSRAFRDAHDAPARTARMVRINDNMRYAHLTEWDAEAVEISYATPGLKLLLLVPRGISLRTLSERVSSVSLNDVISRMKPLRVAVSLPIYTLRMTLLLPNKLQAMGISRLVELNSTKHEELKLSHAVQRMMFWAEAGRNAFKDDGIEWDERPKLEMVVDRPYLFFMRWHNLTLMNGNFVL